MFVATELLESSSVTLDPIVASLARSIASDLRSAGVDAVLDLSNGRVGLTMPEHARIDDALVSASLRLKANELRHSEVTGPSINAVLPTERSVAAACVSPVLRIATTNADRRLFEYCRLSQHVPSGQRIGRQVRALVFDVGQAQGPKLMGAIGLASPLYAVGCRDRFLDWSGTAARGRKNVGLRRMMDLHLCTALPPYNSMFGVKLLAALALSDEILAEFERRYDDILLGVTTSCASGTHCAAFNRIMLSQGGLYRRVGVTAGYTLAWMRPETLQLARRVVDGRNAVTPHSILEFDLKPLVVVRRALKVLGIPFDQVLRLGRQKGIYFAQAFAGAADLLRKGDSIARRPDSLTEEDAVAYWRDRLLSRRLHTPPPSSQDAA